MATVTLGGLDNNVAAIELDRCVFAAHGNAKLGALIHLHHGAISQAQHGMRSSASTDEFAFRYFVAHFERHVTAITYAAQHATERFHTCAHPLRPGSEFTLGK